MFIGAVVLLAGYPPRRRSTRQLAPLPFGRLYWTGGGSGATLDTSVRMAGDIAVDDRIEALWQVLAELVGDPPYLARPVQRHGIGPIARASEP